MKNILMFCQSLAIVFGSLISITSQAICSDFLNEESKYSSTSSSNSSSTKFQNLVDKGRLSEKDKIEDSIGLKHNSLSALTSNPVVHHNSVALPQYSAPDLLESSNLGNIILPSLDNVNNTAKEDFLVISIDGGGIRGILPATFLRYIEDDLEKEFDARINLAECIDLFAGTSTGGLIAIGLNIPNKLNTSPRYNAAFIADFYKNQGETLFPHDLRIAQSLCYTEFFTKCIHRSYQAAHSIIYPMYKRGVLEMLLDKHFSLGIDDSPSLEQSFSELVIPAYSATLGQLKIFQKNNIGSMRDAALATSAAPYYFAAYNDPNGVMYLDGGLIANDPALNIFQNTQFLEAFGRKHIHILSISTGHKARNTCTDMEKLGGFGVIKSTEKLLSLIMRGTSQNTKEIFKAIHHKLSDGVISYTIVDPIIVKDRMDDTKQVTSLVAIAKEEYEKPENALAIKEFKDKIKSYVNCGKLFNKRLSNHTRAKSLNSLDLSHLPLKLLSPLQLTHLDRYKSIVNLDLSNTLRRIQDVTVLLKQLKGKFPNLNVLNLSHNDLGKNLAFNESKFLNHIPLTLRILKLAHNYITDDHVLTIKNYLDHFNPSQLILLDLSFNKFSEIGLISILPSLPNQVPFLLNVFNQQARIILNKGFLKDNPNVDFIYVKTKDRFYKTFNNSDKACVLH